jgi:hypothetical protein
MLLQEKHWHLVLLLHSWQHLVVLNWLLAPAKNTKTLQCVSALTENSKCQFHISVYVDVNSILGLLHVVDVDSVAGASEVHVCLCCQYRTE